MLRSISQGLKTELEGASWGLLPALLCLAWLSLNGTTLSLPKALMVTYAALMASYDVAIRRIPNILTALTALTGLAWGLVVGGVTGGFWALLGGLSGLGLMAVFFLIGIMGAGDVKGIAALATFLSPFGALHLMVLTLISGGFFALAQIIAKNNLRGLSTISPGLVRLGRSGLTMPYGLAILAGTMLLQISGGGGI